MASVLHLQLVLKPYEDMLSNMELEILVEPRRNSRILASCTRLFRVAYEARPSLDINLFIVDGVLLTRTIVIVSSLTHHFVYHIAMIGFVHISRCYAVSQLF
eukprot:5743221-Amphidinium_carterae.1